MAIDGLILIIGIIGFVAISSFLIPSVSCNASASMLILIANQIIGIIGLVAISSFLLLFSIRTVRQTHKGLVERMGKFNRVVSAGLTILKCKEEPLKATPKKGE